MSTPVITAESFRNDQYVSLVTTRRNGSDVHTPVWFAVDNDKLYVFTAANAGKVKRIRANQKVSVAVCSMRGEVTGPLVSGTALVLDESKGTYVHGLLNRKYTWKKKIFEFVESVPSVLRIRKKTPDAFLEITLAAE
jgi:uncharacterized protein